MLPTCVRIFVCTVPQDMRRSFDTLARVVRELLGQDPQSGALYLFVGKGRTRCKVLWWERNGYCLLSKRLHRALFVVPDGEEEQGPALRIDAVALSRLLCGVVQEGRRRKSS